MIRLGFPPGPHVMTSSNQTWWTRGMESPGGIPEAVLARRVTALGELAIGECAFADAPLEEFRHDMRFHPSPGTPERSYRRRWLTSEEGAGDAVEFWMRMG